jgi:putative membrane protein
MRHGTIALLSAAALAVAACGQKSGDTASNGAAGGEASNMGAGDDAMLNGTAPAASGAQAFANTAASSDAFEIATSQLAQGSAKSAAVKAFARKMIEGHTASTAKLKTAAAAATPAVTPDPALTADQQQRLDALRGKTGADFDTAYAAEQVAAHEMTLSALKAYAANGEAASLKTFASGMVPTVAAHLNMAKGLKP